MEYKITVMKNAFYAQSGGVTSVINCSAYGVISKFKKDFSNIVGPTLVPCILTLARARTATRPRQQLASLPSGWMRDGA